MTQEPSLLHSVQTLAPRNALTFLLEERAAPPLHASYPDTALPAVPPIPLFPTDDHESLPPLTP